MSNNSGRGFPDYLTDASLPLWSYAEMVLRMEHVVLMGVVARVDYSAGKARVLVSKSMLTEWLPWLVSRAGGDITWDAPDIGETVMLISPSGNPNNGFLLPASNKTVVPHRASSPDFTQRVWRVRKQKETDAAKVEDTDEGLQELLEQLAKEPELEDLENVKYAASPKIMAIEQFNRRTAQRRHRVADVGSLSWEVHDFARIFADKEKIELRVKGTEGTDESQSTRLVITKDDIAMYVHGKKTQLLLKEDSASLQVKVGDSGAVIDEEWNAAKNRHTRKVRKDDRSSSKSHAYDGTDTFVEGNAAFSLRKTLVNLELRHEKRRLSFGTQGVDVRADQGILSLLSTQSGHAFIASIPGSKLTMLSDNRVLLESTLVLINSAPFKGTAKPGATYALGTKPGDALAALTLPSRTVKVPDFVQGSAPSMPES